MNPRALFALFAIASVGLGCSSNHGFTNEACVSGITPDVVTVNVGDSVTFDTYVVNAAPNPSAGDSAVVTWSTSGGGSFASTTSSVTFADDAGSPNVFTASGPAGSYTITAEIAAAGGCTAGTFTALLTIQ